MESEGSMQFSCTRSYKIRTMTYEGVSKSFRIGRLERELQMVELSATSCSRIAILWVSLASFAAIILCVASQRVFIVVVYFVIGSIRKLLDTPSYVMACFYASVTLFSHLRCILCIFRIIFCEEELCSVADWAQDVLIYEITYIV